MFDKEAEEYVHTKHCEKCSTGHCEKKCVLVKDDYETFKDGAEFGYNKAKEETQAQIEKLIDFVLSKTECCDVCPITDTCINSEGTCPYAGILAKGEEEVTRIWLMQYISRR